MLTAVTGINWGDEGKGRMVDLLSENQDIVVRYQGGNNAGHTVVTDIGKNNPQYSSLWLSLSMSSIYWAMEWPLTWLIQRVKWNASVRPGVKIGPENLKISDKAIICMPYNVAQDCLEEDRLADAKFGSTRRGIGPIYGDKYLKKALRMGDLLQRDYLQQRLQGILEWKNLTIENVYHSQPFEFEEMMQWLDTYGAPLIPYIGDTGNYLRQAEAAGKRIMFEAQLGALRDIDFGIYPFTSSSSTIAAYAPVGAGVPNLKLDRVIGVINAYSSCVGEGPFTVELFGEEAEALACSWQ